MLDFIRDLGKSAEEKRQEQVAAYIDDALTPRQREEFEQRLAQDAALQAEVTQLRQLKQNLRRLPRRAAPRNFTLDPAIYGAPQRQPLVQLYPAMRVATALTAVFFVIAVVAGAFAPGLGGADMAAPVAMESEAVEEAGSAEIAADVAESASAPEANAAAQAVEEAPAAAAAVEEEAAAEEMAADEAADEVDESPPLTAEATPDLLQPGVEITTMEEESAETAGDGESAAATGAPTPTADTPRVQPTAAADRAAPAATEISAAPAPTVTDEAAAETAVELPPPPAASFSALRFFQVGLGILLVTLVLILVYTRRQM